MPFVIGGRATLAIEDGPFAGVSCEVDTVNSTPIQFMALNRATAVSLADGGAESVNALRELYDLFASLARPVWNLVDPVGPIPTTANGMLRVPEALMYALVDLWVDTLPVPDEVEVKRADIEKRARATAATRK